MQLEYFKLTLGPLPNNVYLLADQESGAAVVIDPSFESQSVLTQAAKRNWQLRQVWLTHGHFDHIAGAEEVACAFDPALPVGLHHGDAAWYESGGGAAKFGLSIPQPPAPSIQLEHGMQLSLDGGMAPAVEVRWAPGHSNGHVMFYCKSLGVLFCGDVIFREGIGRTDLAGGDMLTLIESIRAQVFTLPDDTKLLPGHGPESTVGYEKVHNPFL